MMQASSPAKTPRAEPRTLPVLPLALGASLALHAGLMAALWRMPRPAQAPPRQAPVAVTLEGWLPPSGAGGGSLPAPPAAPVPAVLASATEAARPSPAETAALAPSHPETVATAAPPPLTAAAPTAPPVLAAVPAPPPAVPEAVPASQQPDVLAAAPSPAVASPTALAAEAAPQISADVRPPAAVAPVGPPAAPESPPADTAEAARPAAAPQPAAADAAIGSQAPDAAPTVADDTLAAAAVPVIAPPAIAATVAAANPPVGAAGPAAMSSATAAPATLAAEPVPASDIAAIPHPIAVPTTAAPPSVSGSTAASLVAAGPGQAPDPAAVALATAGSAPTPIAARPAAPAPDARPSAASPVVAEGVPPASAAPGRPLEPPGATDAPMQTAALTTIPDAQIKATDLTRDEAADAAAILQIRSYIAGYPTGPCVFLSPTRVTPDTAQVDEFADTKDAFDHFDKAFHAGLGLEARVTGQRVEKPQCPAIEFLRGLAGSAEPPTLALDATTVSAGHPLSGAVTGLNGRHLTFLMVLEDGTVQDLAGALRLDGASSRFRLDLGSRTKAVSLPRLLLAIASHNPLVAPRQSGEPVGVYLQAIGRAADARGDRLGATAKLILLGG